MADREAPDDTGGGALSEHRDGVRDLARRILRDPAWAEDVAQEALLRAYRDRATIEGARAAAWLTKVGRRLAIDESRFRKRMESRAELEEHADFDADPALVAEHRELLEQVSIAIKGLGARQRRLLLAQVATGVSLHDLARAEQTTTASVRSVLARARESIRASLREAGWQIAACSTRVPTAVQQAVDRLGARIEQLSPRIPRWPGSTSDALPAIAAAISLLFAPSTQVPSEEPLAVLETAALSVASSSVTAVDERLRTPGLRRSASNALDKAHTIDDEAQRTIAFFETDGDIVQFAVAPDQQTILANGGYDETAESEASGALVKEWEPVLYRSHDGGRNWHRIRTAGFVPGRVLFPPAWPADPRIFVVTERGVIRSADDGRTFQRLAPLTSADPADTAATSGAVEETAQEDPSALIRSEQRPSPVLLRPAVLSPRFSDGDERIYLGSPAEVTDVRMGTTEPLVSVPPWGDSRGIAPASDYATSDAVLVSGTVGTTATRPRAALFRCAHRQCTQLHVFDDISEPPGVFTSSVDPNLLYVWTTYAAYRSIDGGATWRRQNLGPVVELTEVGPRLVFLSLSDPPISDDGGATWRNLEVLYSISAVAGVGTERLLLASGLGMACSPDRGEHWHPVCS